MLQEKGIKALPYHAGMDQLARQTYQIAFMTDPGVVIVATIAFGMGIDKPDIRYVLHTDLPASPEAYYQEIGRAGRDGAPAETMLFYGLDDIRMRRVFIEEAAGISKYKERRRETENRMRRTSENLERLTDLRDELERNLAHLDRQARAAEKYSELKAEERVVQSLSLIHI